MKKAKLLELPPVVAKAFVRDMRAFFREKNAVKRDLIAVHQLKALQEFQGPRERRLRLNDVVDMFHALKDRA